ncbi:Hypp9262 [Branchiostoma lanceolatum]|uniref:Hypp9262 protein n=1 Tax=Branchiostoma lanceolatum TaxID=7740 RepID=A0A8J9ZD43_BRALA|nr:Hypp9262 [Branchiostoma lanceolatum]
MRDFSAQVGYDNTGVSNVMGTEGIDDVERHIGMFSTLGPDAVSPRPQGIRDARPRRRPLVCLRRIPRRHKTGSAVTVQVQSQAKTQSQSQAHAVAPMSTAPRGSGAELRALRERITRLESREQVHATERLLREARAYTVRRGPYFEPATMAALLKALDEAAVASGHPEGRNFSATAFDAQLEAGPGGQDWQELAIKFIGDPEQVAVADTVRMWRKVQGAGSMVTLPDPYVPPHGPTEMIPSARPPLRFPPTAEMGPDQCRMCLRLYHFAKWSVPPTPAICYPAIGAKGRAYSLASMHGLVRQ